MTGVADQPEVMDPAEWADVGSGDVASRGALGPLARTGATVESDCEECGFSIAVGDVIALAVEGGPWVHERCAS